MRHTEWKCDNHCGQTRVGDARPMGWIILNMDDHSMFVACSYDCLAEWAWKAANGLPMGFKAELSGRVAE